MAMRLTRLDDIAPGMVLARPARSDAGVPLMTAGTVLDAEHLASLARTGVQELWVVAAGEVVPDTAVPEYMDRYGPDFPARLQRVFAGALVNRTMQRLFLGALAHAADCYRRYRVDHDREERR
jgi:hypothetical protein